MFWIGFDEQRGAGFIEFHNGLRVWYPDPRLVRDQETGEISFVYARHRKAQVSDKKLWRGEVMNNAVQGMAHMPSSRE